MKVRATMRRTTALAAAAAIALVAVPMTVTPASAATQNINITKTGYDPLTQSIKVGDTITFTNTDTVNHQVVFKQTGGFTCTATPIVVQPSKTQSCTFTVVDKYTFTEPRQAGNAWNGTINVSANVVVVPTISLDASPATITYGEKVALSGKVTPANAGTSVDILAQASGETAFTKVTTVTTAAGGAFTASVSPEIGTTYRADFTSGGDKVSSSVRAIEVRPNVVLNLRFVKKAKAYFVTKVTSSINYAGATLRVQRQNRLGGWTTLRTVTLGGVSSVRFVVKLPKGLSHFRTVLTASQAGAGYLPGTSNVVEVGR